MKKGSVLPKNSGKAKASKQTTTTHQLTLKQFEFLREVGLELQHHNNIIVVPHIDFETPYPPTQPTHHKPLFLQIVNAHNR